MHTRDIKHFHLYFQKSLNVPVTHVRMELPVLISSMDMSVSAFLVMKEPIVRVVSTFTISILHYLTKSKLGWNFVSATTGLEYQKLSFKISKLKYFNSLKK